MKVKKSVFGLVLFLAIHCSLFTVSFADEIRSRAAVVMDSTTGRVLYAKNPDLRLLPASTTKLMTALVVVEKANLNDVVTISKKAAGTAPTKAGFKEGDRVTIETLLYAALMKSANDAAVALAEGVGGTEEQFVKMMNTKAMAIGANDTRFINANGLPGNGQYITAYDLSKIMRQAIKYPVLREVLKTRTAEISTEAGKTMSVKSTNKLLWSDGDILGGKTGYTRQARHCFVCAGERDNETIIVSILGAPVRGLLWKESEDLIDYGSKVMSNQKEPLVYFSGNDSRVEAGYGTETAEATAASYAAGDKSGGYRPAKKHHLKYKTAHAGKKRCTRTAYRKRHKKSGAMVAAAGPAGEQKQSLNKKKAVRMIAKKWKRQRIAKVEADGAKG